MSDPDSANTSTRGWIVSPARLHSPNHKSSRNAPNQAATTIIATSAMEVGIGVPTKYLTGCLRHALQGATFNPLWPRSAACPMHIVIGPCSASRASRLCLALPALVKESFTSPRTSTRDVPLIGV